MREDRYDMSIDEMVDRLAEIQDELRPLLKEQEALRAKVKEWAADHGLSPTLQAQYLAPSGHGLTFYTQTRPHVDIDYLQRILSRPKFRRAVRYEDHPCMRVT